MIDCLMSELSDSLNAGVAGGVLMHALACAWGRSRGPQVLLCMRMQCRQRCLRIDLDREKLNYPSVTLTRILGFWIHPNRSC